MILLNEYIFYIYSVPAINITNLSYYLASHFKLKNNEKDNEKDNEKG